MDLKANGPSMVKEQPRHIAMSDELFNVLMNDFSPEEQREIVLGLTNRLESYYEERVAEHNGIAKAFTNDLYTFRGEPTAKAVASDYQDGRG